MLLLCKVRRTRISDRIRKLQELVPNMDKVSYLLEFLVLLSKFCINSNFTRALTCASLRDLTPVIFTLLSCLPLQEK